MASPEAVARIDAYVQTLPGSNDERQAAHARLTDLADRAERGDATAAMYLSTLGVTATLSPSQGPQNLLERAGGLVTGQGSGFRLPGFLGSGGNEISEEPTGAEEDEEELGATPRSYVFTDPVTGEEIVRYGFEDPYGRVSGTFAAPSQESQQTKKYGEFTTLQLPGGRVSSGYPILDAEGNQIGFDDIGGSYALPSGAGGIADPNAAAYLKLAQDQFGFAQSRFSQEHALEQDKFGQDKLKSQITAARTGKPLEYLSLLRGSPVRYAGTSPVVPMLDQEGVAAGGSGEGAPELPGALAAVQAGEPVRTTGVPTLRAPGVQAQANMTPFEASANREFGETMGVPSADQESYEELLRRGFKSRASVTNFG